MKTCKKCNLEKDESEFSKNKRTTDGLNIYCKSCLKEPYHNLSPEEKAIHNKKYRPSKEILSMNSYRRHKERMESDEVYKLRHNLRASFNNILKAKGFKKEMKTHEILGCTYEFFHKHIEDQFEPWMNWTNKGDINGICHNINETWDIDHIVPISSVSSLEDVIKLNHYTNLRPLCSYTNRYIKRNIVTT